VKEENKPNKVIAFYIGSLARGGAEHVIVNLATYFCGQGYKVFIVTKMIDEPEYSVPEGVERIIADITPDEECSSRIANLYHRIKKLADVWKRIKPDIIVSFIRKNNLMAIASTVGMKIPVAVGIRSNPARELQGKYFKALSFFMFRFADGIIMQTTQGVNYLPDYLKYKAVIMPNSVSEQFVGKAYNRDRNKEISVVGRIDDNKNQAMILRVFENIKEKYPDWSLHLYGDGEKKAELEERYACSSIVFHGQVSDMAQYIGKSAIFVLPSKQEGMPNALIEAMAMGNACISTDCPCGGPADLIKDGINGFLIPVDDDKTLLRRIKYLIEDDKLRENMGREAMKVSEDLAPDIVNEKWEKYLLKLMDK